MKQTLKELKEIGNLQVQMGTSIPIPQLITLSENQQRRRIEQYYQQKEFHIYKTLQQPQNTHSAPETMQCIQRQLLSWVIKQT